jgi:hypothetical protein
MSLGPVELIILLLVASMTIVPIWALVDAIRVPSDSDFRAGTKVIWVLVILLLSGAGALVCFFVGRPRPRV